MSCPCHNCLVYIRCQQRVEKQKFRKDVYYAYDSLVKECDLLKDYFGLNTLIHKVKVKTLSSFSYTYENTLMSYIEEQPGGKQLVEEFLKVMHVDEMPNSLNPKIRLKGRK